MPLFSNLPIMPKESKVPMTRHASISSAPYPVPDTSNSSSRNAAIWSSSDDDILLQARQSGLNWKPIADRHFPNKTANACRKRHERLIERRHVEDWDAQKLEQLAHEYLAVRKEMWELLASRVGERWAVVEAKCMEKGLKTIQSTARTAQRKASAGSQGQNNGEERGRDRGMTDNTSDSGIGMEDTEMEVGEPDAGSSHVKSSSWAATYNRPQQTLRHDHSRSQSLPQPLPLYRPPPPIKRTFEVPMTTSPQTISFGGPTSFGRYSPDASTQRGISIQAVLSPAEPMRS